MTRVVGTCDRCGGDLEMYYTPWCPLCDKPEPVIKPVLNYIKCVRHVVRKHNLDDDPTNGHERRLWLWVIDSPGFANDIYISIDFDTAYHESLWDEDDNGDMMVKETMGLLIKEFDLENQDVLWEISW